jgi:hypothetical protein
MAPWPNKTTHTPQELEEIAKDLYAYDVDRINAIESVDDIVVLTDIAATNTGAVADAARYRLDAIDDWD